MKTIEDYLGNDVKKEELTGNRDFNLAKEIDEAQRELSQLLVANYDNAVRLYDYLIAEPRDKSSEKQDVPTDPGYLRKQRQRMFDLIKISKETSMYLDRIGNEITLPE